MQSFPFLMVFLTFLGFAVVTIFCTCFCRICNRRHQIQIERDAQRCREQESHMRSIYFIPFPRSLSQQDSEDPQCVEAPTFPQYNTIYYETPPPYNELEFKSDVLPPSYTESNSPEYH